MAVDRRRPVDRLPSRKTEKREKKESVQYATSVLDKKDPIQAMVVNVAEKSERDFDRHD